jgi:hypothetical protein
MTSQKTEFIHIEDAYVNVDSISFIRVRESELIIHLRGLNQVFSARSPYPPEVKDFLANHTVLDVHGEPPIPGAVSV